MNDYVKQLDLVLSSGNRKLLADSGKVSHTETIEKAKDEYQKYQITMLSPVEQAYLDTIKEVNKTVES